MFVLKNLTDGCVKTLLIFQIEPYKNPIYMIGFLLLFSVLLSGSPSSTYDFHNKEFTPAPMEIITTDEGAG